MIEMCEMIKEVSQKVQKVEEMIATVEKIRHVEKSMSDLIDETIVLQCDVESKHDEFMRYVDVRFESMLNTMRMVTNSTIHFKDIDYGEASSIEERDDANSDIVENAENEIKAEGTIVEKSLKDYMDEYIKGAWSIEEYLKEEDDEVDLS